MTKPVFLAPGAVCFMNSNNGISNEIYFESNGITYSTKFKLNGKQYKQMHDALVAVIKEHGIDLSDMCY